ncbi:MAG: NPCBM/NEW2 domain-containing protein [Planctomycetes bacterium]|nr:NPCBM/NEW2 domain-containing protein [Planctomycetota bacterium]
MTRNRTLLLAALAAAGCSFAPRARAADAVWLSDLDLTPVRQGWGRPQVNRSIRERPLAIAGQGFERGVGTHARSVLWIDLAGGAERLLASVGVDDAAGGPGSVAFRVFGDGKALWESGTMTPGQPARRVDVDLRGVRTLLLLVGDAGDGIDFDHADWADARLIVSGARPRAIAAPREEAVLLTPKPGPAPRINGPAVYGCRPARPFLYRVPAQGERPMAFAADGLPATLRIDARTGIIAGTAPGRGEHRVTLRAKNAHGEVSRAFKIVSGDALALTPPMGWNHWYAHYNRVTDAMMREAADVMVSSGMADVGYSYVSIDDCWMNAPKHADPLRVGPLRDERGDIVPNKHFPDMVALTDHIHSLGLKAGIYTSPGPLTCAGFAGSHDHEAQDAARFAAWGFDFLKYDWCSYGEIAKGDGSRAALVKPYALMGEILKRQERDIVLNLCQYGMGNVWEWGAEVGGHSWRTAGDLGFELDRVFEVALVNAEHRAWSKPGAWNDPDYLQIGHVGDAREGGLPRPCPLSPSEQYAFLSLWCLMAAPLFYSGDMSRLDELTLNVLCNPEVIEVDQDPLGRCAAVKHLTEDTFVMVKDMEDGSKAVGLFNEGEVEAAVAARWPDLGLSGKQRVRDLWRQRDLGELEGEFKASLPRRGGALVRVWPVKP